MKSRACEAWLNELSLCISAIQKQEQTLDLVARKIFDSLVTDQVLHVFGSGHSNMVTEEFFHRAGGLIPVNPIFVPHLMAQAGPRTTGPLERTPGIGSIIAGTQDFRPGEVIIIASNSGINPVSSELALAAKEKNVYTVGLTSLTHSKAVNARAGNKKLYEVCDAVIDTAVPYGDAAISVSEGSPKVGPLSSVVNTVICEMLVVRVAEFYQETGKPAPIYQSANTPGGESQNQSLEEKYKTRIKYL